MTKSLAKTNPIDFTAFLNSSPSVFNYVLQLVFKQV